jgi:hypothetical protein
MAVPAKSLSAPRRLIEPSASALARSSKERLVDSWLTCCPLSPKGGTRQPRQLANAPTLARGDEFPMNFVPFRAIFLANFREFYEGEVRRNQDMRSSQNSMNAEFAEFLFHALQ